MYLNSVYYQLDVAHRVAIVDSHGVVVGRLQVAVKSSQLSFHTPVILYCIVLL